MIVAENLKRLRTEKNITQKSLCDELLNQNFILKRNTYTKYENGTRIIPYDVICALAKYYNVTTDYIFGLSSDKN